MTAPSSISFFSSGHSCLTRHDAFSRRGHQLQKGLEDDAEPEAVAGGVQLFLCAYQDEEEDDGYLIRVLDELGTLD